MLIEKHISDLLYRYQCVTVPGFGAFLTETVSAHVTGSASSFFPPKIVVFRNNPKIFYFLENKDQERKWKPNYPEVSGLIGAAPSRADSSPSTSSG